MADFEFVPLTEEEKKQLSPEIASGTAPLASDTPDMVPLDEEEIMEIKKQRARELARTEGGIYPSNYPPEMMVNPMRQAKMKEIDERAQALRRGIVENLPMIGSMVAGAMIPGVAEAKALQYLPRIVNTLRAYKLLPVAKTLMQAGQTLKRGGTGIEAGRALASSLSGSTAYAAAEKVAQPNKPLDEIGRNFLFNFLGMSGGAAVSSGITKLPKPILDLMGRTALEIVGQAGVNVGAGEISRVATGQTAKPWERATEAVLGGVGGGLTSGIRGLTKPELPQPVEEALGRMLTPAERRNISPIMFADPKSSAGRLFRFLGYSSPSDIGIDETVQTLTNKFRQMFPKASPQELRDYATKLHAGAATLSDMAALRQDPTKAGSAMEELVSSLFEKYPVDAKRILQTGYAGTRSATNQEVFDGLEVLYPQSKFTTEKVGVVNRGEPSNMLQANLKQAGKDIEGLIETVQSNVDRQFELPKYTEALAQLKAEAYAPRSTGSDVGPLIEKMLADELVTDAAGKPSGLKQYDPTAAYEKLKQWRELRERMGDLNAPNAVKRLYNEATKALESDLLDMVSQMKVEPEVVQQTTEGLKQAWRTYRNLSSFNKVTKSVIGKGELARPGEIREAVEKNISEFTDDVQQPLLERMAFRTDRPAQASYDTVRKMIQEPGGRGLIEGLETGTQPPEFWRALRDNPDLENQFLSKIINYAAAPKTAAQEGIPPIRSLTFNKLSSVMEKNPEMMGPEGLSPRGQKILTDILENPLSREQWETREAGKILAADLPKRPTAQNLTNLVSKETALHPATLDRMTATLNPKERGPWLQAVLDDVTASTKPETVTKFGGDDITQLNQFETRLSPEMAWKIVPPAQKQAVKDWLTIIKQFGPNMELWKPEYYQKFMNQIRSFTSPVAFSSAILGTLGMKAGMPRAALGAFGVLGLLMVPKAIQKSLATGFSPAAARQFETVGRLFAPAMMQEVQESGILEGNDGGTTSK